MVIFLPSFEKIEEHQNVHLWEARFHASTMNPLTFQEQPLNLDKLKEGLYRFFELDIPEDKFMIGTSYVHHPDYATPHYFARLFLNDLENSIFVMKYSSPSTPFIIDLDAKV